MSNTIIVVVLKKHMHGPQNFAMPDVKISLVLGPRVRFCPQESSILISALNLVLGPSVGFAPTIYGSSLKQLDGHV